MMNPTKQEDIHQNLAEQVLAFLAAQGLSRYDAAAVIAIVSLVIQHSDWKTGTIN